MINAFTGQLRGGDVIGAKHTSANYGIPLAEQLELARSSLSLIKGKFGVNTWGLPYSRIQELLQKFISELEVQHTALESGGAALARLKRWSPENQTP